MKRFIGVLVVLLSFLFVGCGMEQVDEGFRGIETNWGKVVGEPLKPGLYFYNPISSDIFEMDVREHKLTGTTPCFTKDTQSVSVEYALTVYPDATKIGELYKQFGNDWSNKIVSQAILGSMKDAIGKYIADELVQKRDEAKKESEKEIIDALATRGIILTRLDFTNLDFDDAYEKAVEDKVVAVQRAVEAKNKTAQVEQEAKQVITRAEADAEAMRIKSNALQQNKGLVQYEAVQKWDGKLPEIMMGNTTPIINLDSIRNQ